MLKKITVPVMPVIRKKVDGADASTKGAFAIGKKLEFTVETPRKLGASAVVLRICRDGESDCDMPMVFSNTLQGIDYYTLSLDTEILCGEDGQGLFFYEFLFVRGADTLFTSTCNQVDFTLERCSEKRFVLLVYENDYTVPSWFYGRIMYHVFIDRFCKGDGVIAMRDDVILNEDWNNGIPQYPKKNGDRFANNMFFGGNLWGIAEKIEYFKSLGVGVLYLSPIFEAYSNHKYDTGDYLKIDGMFGGEDAFLHLLEKARKANIRIILDGVFNHTGDNSLYFDRYGSYGGKGAYSDRSSPYRDWFQFRQYPNEYETWWGIDILPKLNLKNNECRAFFTGKGGVCERYIQSGIGGWRLDVADELTDQFLDELRRTVKSTSNDQGIIIGEVWENAALKEAYGSRRRYFRGRQLDSVMNYPIRNGIIQFILEKDAEFLSNILKEIYATYPTKVCHALMNLLSTHDTERILTVLGEGSDRTEGEDNDTLAIKRLSPQQLKRGIERLKIAAALQYTVYGVPSLFYGDEAGVEGYHDPFCRRPYPWKRQNKALLAFYRRLGKIRCAHSVFENGDFYVERVEKGFISFVRENSHEKIYILANVNDGPIEHPMRGEFWDLLSNRLYANVVLSNEVLILQRKQTKEKK